MPYASSLLDFLTGLRGDATVMTMKTLAVAILWHLHQPYYTDPLTHTSPFPWVRLHAIKGYFDMAVLLEQYPAMQVTVNLTPSLLLQLQELESGRVTDTFFRHASCPAADLSEQERLFILRHFFAANWNTMVKPYQHYYGLLIRRGREVVEAELASIAQRFSTQDFLDLQVWHNLAWFGHAAMARYSVLRELKAKGRHFTESDKQAVLAIQHEVIAQVTPLFRVLAERGQIELSTTPFFHPILPLVIDTDFARRARPDSALPRRFAHPEDARAQLQQAVEFHHSVFGQRPTGVWPSEGSVCPELIPMLSDLGIRWTATDEGILAASVGDWNRDAQLYRPYRVAHDGSQVDMLFRDREVSDAVGFTYSRNDPGVAVGDFAGRLSAVADRSPEARPVVSVILDGENPWEYYPDGGEAFLRGLYSAITKGEHGNVRFEAVVPSRELAEHPATVSLDRLHTGSWINSDFRIWIGHPEDNDAWERLGKTRDFLERHQHDASSPQDAQAAWTELYAAEGSDWFWWYGDDFETDHKGIFDQLFRLHLANVFRNLGHEVPEFLLLPIWQGRSQDAQVRQPVVLISPCVDGVVTDFYEWRGAGVIEAQPALTAMYRAPALFSRVYFGCSLDQLFLRFDFAEVSPDETEEAIAVSTGNNGGAPPLEVVVQLLEPHHAKLVFRLDAPEELRLFKSVDGINFVLDGVYDSIRRKKIIELAAPLKDLGCNPGSAAQLVIKVLEGGLERERLPPSQPLTISVPDETFEAKMWKA
jgi:alpha-amylase/alpha-mannosidase (GH57 family)